MCHPRPPSGHAPAMQATPTVLYSLLRMHAVPCRLSADWLKKSGIEQEANHNRNLSLSLAPSLSCHGGARRGRGAWQRLGGRGQGWVGEDGVRWRGGGEVLTNPPPLPSTTGGRCHLCMTWATWETGNIV